MPPSPPAAPGTYACIERDPSFAATGAAALIEGRRATTPLPMLAMIALHANGRGELLPTGIGAEFPRSDARLAGRPRRYSLHTGLYGHGPIARGVGLFDWNRGHDSQFDFGAKQLVEEFLFVADGSGERDGWLVGTTLNLDARATELHLLRADDIASGPIATWRGAAALPVGFHGVFVAA